MATESKAELKGKQGFPSYGIMPKTETQAESFVTKCPKNDGRGIVVAILDTGTDPGAPGLQVTTDGKPKIIDIVDCTGSGDVDCSTVVTPNDKGEITGLTGRVLKLGEWENPTQKYYIGVKASFELFPKKLSNRIKAARTREWETKTREHSASLHRQILAETNLEKKKDLETLLAESEKLAKNTEDPGPIYDCVVFHDGSNWRAVVDTSESGDLASCGHPMADFRVERQYRPFTPDDLMNFSVNIFNEGRILSIVTNAGSHGTHVAGIVGGHFPDQPELDGIAPGCQMIAIKIGDSRLGSMETGQGLIRGLLYAQKRGCHLINMSYGEPTSEPNRGRFCELATELVNKHGIIFVASAGNNGPALSTVGAPGGTTEAIISVGAYVSPQMMEMEYSMFQPLPETQYSWSSRGPTPNGGQGVCISACGGAITSVPNWTLQRSQLMNGTSMSSPAACGAIALLLSALQQKGKTWSPHRIRRALENTARAVPSVEQLALGCGLLQVEACFSYLERYYDHADQDIFFEVSAGDKRGVYLRVPEEVARPHQVRVSVTPKFKEDVDADAVDLDAKEAKNRDKVAFEMRVNLVSSADWIRIPKHLMLMHGGRSFTIEVDPRGLPAGVSFTEVYGYDSSSPDRGPVFRLPVTVCVPEPVTADHKYSFKYMKYKPGHIARKFLAVPTGATWVELKFTAKGYKSRALFISQNVQLSKQTRHADGTLYKALRLADGESMVLRMPVNGPDALELCLCQYWNSIGDGTVSMTAEFHGIVPSCNPVVLSLNQVRRVDLTSSICDEGLAPSVSFNTLRHHVQPCAFSLTALTERDMMPNGRTVYQMVLSYEWEAKENVKVTPRCPVLNGVLYESPFGAQLLLIFDENKRLLGSHDSWPDAVSIKKGKHVLRLQVRHDDASLLSGLKNTSIALDIALSKPVRATVHRTHTGAMLNKQGGSAHMLRAGQSLPVFFAPVSVDAVKTIASPGDILLGAAEFGKGQDGSASKRPQGFPARVAITHLKSSPKQEYEAIFAPQKTEIKEEVAEAPKEKKEDKKEKTDDSPSMEEDFRDAQIKFIAGIKDLAKQQAALDKLYAGMVAIWPDHLPLLELRVTCAQKLQPKNNDAVLSAVQTILDKIDQKKLAAAMFFKAQPDDTAAIKQRKADETTKKLLISILTIKASVLREQYTFIRKDAKDAKQEELEIIKTTFRECLWQLKNWVGSSKDVKELPGLERFESKISSNSGSLLQMMNQAIPSSGKALREERIQYLEDWGGFYAQLAAREKLAMLVAFPKTYAMH